VPARAIRFDTLVQQIHITAGHVICGLVESDCSRAPPHQSRKAAAAR
jgi:hypothetical protein